MIWRTLRNGLLLGLASVVSNSWSNPNEPVGYLTYDNQTAGTAQHPLVVRTYLPNPGLDREVTARHGKGEPSPKYSAKTGLSSSDSDYQPIEGIPAGIAVSAGPGLSYVWDTTECRLLYAWANGFLDMESYWGPKERGNRKSFDYVPRLAGQLFYKAKGNHPLRINQKPLKANFNYTGHRRADGDPVFTFQVEDSTISVSVSKGESEQTLIVTYTSSDSSDELEYLDPSTAFEIQDQSGGKLSVLIRPNAAETYHGYEKEVSELTEASVEAGEKLYQSFGCMACHSTDGSRNHGPTFLGLAGKEREFPGAGKVVADAAYLRESIINPVAIFVPDYPAGMMPAYPLDEKQVDSLVLYIQSLQ